MDNNRLMTSKQQFPEPAADVDMYGAGRVRFQRDMGINNNIGPGVSVIWNPNLLLNWPEQLSDALTDWREVAP